MGADDNLIELAKVVDKKSTPEELWKWIDEHVPAITALSPLPVKWVIDQMLPYGCLSMLIGSEGSKKSLIAQYLGKAVAHGEKVFLGRAVLSGIPVLYIDRENPESLISERTECMGLKIGLKFRYWIDGPKKMATPEPDDPRVLAWAEKFQGLIVFDSFQDWMNGENENDNAAMIELMGRFRRLARLCAGVLLIHHKNALGERPRGGTAITNLTDMAMMATVDKEDDEIIHLTAQRFRMCAKWEIDVRTHWHTYQRHMEDLNAYYDAHPTVEVGGHWNVGTPQAPIKPPVWVSGRQEPLKRVPYPERFYQLELRRDELASVAVARKKAEKKADGSKKDTTDAQDFERIRELIDANETPRAIETATGVGRPKQLRLAKKFVNKVWSKDSDMWTDG